MSEQILLFDCFGHPEAQSLDVQCGQGRTARFVFSDQKTPRFRGHFGLFVDYSASAGRSYLRYPRNRRVALLCEPNASIPFVKNPSLASRFRCVLTYDRALLERGGCYREMPFGTSFVEAVLLNRPDLTKKHLVSMIGAPRLNPVAGHVLRNEAIERLKREPRVELFGRGIRWIDSKLEGLQHFAFSIAMENCDKDYYFSEKIIDCFLTDTVPVYYGSSEIARYFDPRGMIAFQTVDELVDLINQLNWDLYQEMLPHVRENRRRALENRWATRAGLFERVADEILRTSGSVNRLASKTMYELYSTWIGPLRSSNKPAASKNSHS